MSFSKNDELENLDSVSKRLKYLVEHLGVKQSHMAEKLGLSPSGLHYILNNDVKFSKNAQKIAEYLNVNEQWLTTGQGDIYEENASITSFKVPVFYPDQLKLYYRSQQKEKFASQEYLLTTTNYKNKALGIYITEESFAPRFEVGDKMIIEQISQFKDGEILLVYIAKTNEVLLKQGFQMDKDVILLSPNEHPLRLGNTSDDAIIGAYRECYKKSNIR